jgi:hypothetical protein
LYSSLHFALLPIHYLYKREREREREDNHDDNVTCAPRCFGGLKKFERVGVDSDELAADGEADAEDGGE